jgi:GT2 family glycosyltransferase
MLSLWDFADNHNLEQIIANFMEKNFDPLKVRVGIACLVEAGLLVRDEKKISSNKDHELITGSQVSIVIVGYNSREWLELCLHSIYAQDYEPMETIVVDNGSTDGTAQWVEKNFPEVCLIQLAKSKSLAFAINEGIQEARGDYFILLNPDIQLEQDAIRWLVKVADENPECAGVAAKLKFLSAPAFLNGLGNFVGAIAFGTDNALGHLDLGQFDGLDEVPSACFAGSLIRAKAWEVIGPLDENFPLYYEDSEWCYRARLYGYRIKVSPNAIIYHAMGGRSPEVESVDLAAWKLRRVIYGRLRFVTRILTFWYLSHFLFNYMLEDSARILFSLIKGHWDASSAYIWAWSDYIRSLFSELLRGRAVIQSRRIVSDNKIFELQNNVPVSLVRGGLPQLTWDIVQHYYLPYLISGKTREIKEFSYNVNHESNNLVVKRNYWSLSRAVSIWRLEGFTALLHRIGRDIQWFLMKP